jgi:MFS family permease
MRHLTHNARWLLWSVPFRNLSLSTAYLTPFLVSHGLNASRLFLLQSIFAAAMILWEIPSGMIADRIGRALCIKLSMPLIAVGMAAYGLSSRFWQFVLCELGLVAAYGLIRGIQTALLIDSLRADGLEQEYVRTAQRIEALAYASITVAVPVSVAVVHLWGTGASLIADGLLAVIGIPLTLKLTEAPRTTNTEEVTLGSTGHALRELSRNTIARWLIMLQMALNTSLYLAYWLVALYYAKLGIPVILFGAILAVRCLWMAWLSHRFHHDKRVGRALTVYAGLIGTVYMAMATQQLWLVWVVLGHDVVLALSEHPLNRLLNNQMDEAHRATLNSAVSLLGLLSNALAGPLIGLTVDHVSLEAGMVWAGLCGSTAALVAVWRLHALRAFT